MKSLDDLVVISYLKNDFGAVKETYKRIVKTLDDLNQKKYLLDVSMDSDSSNSCELTLKDKYDLYKILGFDNQLAQRVFEIDRQVLRDKLVNSFSDLEQYLRLNNTIRNYQVSLDDVLTRTIDLSRIGLDEGNPCEHQFVQVDNNLICVFCGASIEEYDISTDDLEFLLLCAKKQDMLLEDVTEEDLPFLENWKQTLESLNLDDETLRSELFRYLRKAKLLDTGLMRNKNTRVFDPKYISVSKFEEMSQLLNQQRLEIESSDTRFKDLLLESCDTARYELRILKGDNIPKMYFDCISDKEKLCLIKAYYNLSQVDFRLNSGYFAGKGRHNDALFCNYMTANSEINTKILELRKR